MNNKLIKLGVIGTSAITDKFLSAVELSGRFVLSAIYSRTYEKGRAFAEKYGNIPVFTKLSDMANFGIEAVYIASPNVCHYEQSKFFIENKINVICEKPIVTSLNQYSELKALADKNDVIYMEAIMSMYSPYYDTLHNAVKKIGKISVARIDFGQRSSRLDDFYKGIPQNIFNMKLHAGTLMDLGVYCVYGAVDLFGEPKKITAQANYFANGCDSSGNAVFSYDDFSAVLTYSKTGQSIIHSEIVGENGVVTVESISQYAGIKLYIDGKEQFSYPVPERKEIMSGEVNAFADFIEKINLELYKEKSVICDAVHSCMDKIKASAKIEY